MSDISALPVEERVKRHIQFAEVQMLQAEQVPPTTRDSFLDEAKDALIRAEHLIPGSGAYRLACINARVGKTKLCREWLERAKKAGTLPSSKELNAAPYLKDVRGQKWFKRLLNE